MCVFYSLSIYNGIFNKAAVKFEDERDQYISSVQYLTLLVGILMSVVILGFHSVIEEWTGFSFKLLLLMCIHILMFPSFQYWAQKQRFLFEYKNLVVLTLLNSFLSLLLGVAFVLISEEKSLALISVTVGVQAIINLFIFVSLSRKGRCFYRKEFWIWSFVSALPLIPHYLSEILLGHADRIMINQMCGPSQAGIYNIVYQLSMIMTIVRTGINGSFIPWLFVSMKAGRYDAIRRNTSAITVMMAAMTSRTAGGMGEGVEIDLEKAVEWFTKAAEQGNMNAQFYLGVCYECGEGIEQNYEKAAEWYIKAAEQGMHEAQFNIAMFYKYGDGVNKDLAECVKWLICSLTNQVIALNVEL